MSGGVAGLIETLPERYKAEGTRRIDARYRICIGDEALDVVVTRKHCRVEPPSGIADAEIVTDAVTWRAMDEGRLSGIEAFADRRLAVRGSIERSLHFEPLFERPAAGALSYSIDDVSLGGIELSVLSVGDPTDPPLLLLHGLGATKASWLTVIPALARRHRVLAVDLPGFGASSKPRGRYDATWFAEHAFRLLEVLSHDDAYVAGNSLGGRVAMEMAMMEPERVRAITCLCPAAAFTYRPALQFVRLLRPEFGLMAARLPRERLRESMNQLFAEPGRLEEGWFDAAIDDFLDVWRSPRARLAFFTAARNVYLDEPDGDAGFWSRLAHMKPPALYVYGRRDQLISSRFGARVRGVLPSASVLVWDDCGHVPQIEHPERTAKAMLDFYASVEQGAEAV